MRWLLAGAVLALSAHGASAQISENSRWVSAPDGQLATDLFPSFAGFLGVSGYATVQCFIAEDGPPFRCRVMAESPGGLGFGGAARLVVASGNIRAARMMDGAISPGMIRTTVRFSAPEVDPVFGSWTGPEPSPRQIALARQALGGLEDISPIQWRDMLLEGLDHDRKAVVLAWLEELAPNSREQQLQAASLQLARVYSEQELLAILAGETVRSITPYEMLAACPDPTPEEMVALDELRRRYCDRYGC